MGYKKDNDIRYMLFLKLFIPHRYLIKLKGNFETYKDYFYHMLGGQEETEWVNETSMAVTKMLYWILLNSCNYVRILKYSISIVRTGRL